MRSHSERFGGFVLSEDASHQANAILSAALLFQGYEKTDPKFKKKKKS